MTCFVSGPAPEAVTNAIFQHTTTIKEYLICPDLNADISKLGTQTFKVDKNTFTVEIMDPVADYMAYMKEIFNFASIKSHVSGPDGKLNILINSMHGGMFNVNLFTMFCILYHCIMLDDFIGDITGSIIYNIFCDIF